MTQHPHADLSAYIDRALDPAAQAAVDGHLVACALCRAYVAELRAASSFVRALPDPVPSRRLVPRLASPAPAWLAPLRTLMTIASGASVFLFIASALATNITFLSGTGAAPAAQIAREAVRDTAANAASTGAQNASSAAAAPAPTPQAGFELARPTASPNPDAVRGAAGPRAPASDDAAKIIGRVDQAPAGPTGAPPAAAYNPQETGRLLSAEPRRSPLVNPWLWLAVALLCAAIAFALQRRLRA